MKSQTMNPSEFKLEQGRRAQAEFKPPSECKKDQTRKMSALQWYGKGDIRMSEVSVPLVTDPTDVVVRVTATTVSASDLHRYKGQVPLSTKGDILGHEAIGIVDQVGPEVKKFKKGDRVVISAILACGQCNSCNRKEWSCCQLTSAPNKPEEGMYGYHVGSPFGFSHSKGGFDGCQAEYVRVPFADLNLFPIPNEISDRQALLVSDVAATGYHATELANIKEGDNVVVFGSGPVGLMTQMWSWYRGAARVVAIDVDSKRLEFARKNFKSDIINAKEEDPVEAVKKYFPDGPDKVIDCVGFKFPDSLLHKVEQMMSMETDSPNIVNNAIKMVRKNGIVTLIGDYLGYTNHFNIGALMEKHLTLNGGQCWPQNYYKLIFEAIKSKRVDPTVIFTHTYPMSKLPEVYKMCEEHEGGMLKAFITPDNSFSQSEY